MNNTITAEIYETRREKLRKKMHSKGLDALIINYDANRFYLSGFELKDSQKNESSGLLIITSSGKDWLCTDSRFYEAAKRLWDEKYIFIYKTNPAEQIGELIKNNITGKIGFEANTTSVNFYHKLLSFFNTNQTLVPSDGLVEELRIIKDNHEIELLSRACKLNHELMNAVPQMLKNGASEIQIAWDIEQFFRNKGASGLSFESIVAIGKNAALPHAIPSNEKTIDNCPVLVDVGCRLNDYCSDQTRTFWVGDKPTKSFKETFSQVQEAQMAAIEILRPGLSVNEAYSTALNIFKKYKVEQYFTHGLGHGIGLETHETPSLNATRTTILEAGMVITVEPGLYYSDWGGVRLEFMVLITENGYKIL
ncbi:M24 family metallopeptidase [Desulfovibrio litoralis]|uniref:Xaa-Pro aminopeptidase n=1 Tax=Desulfovibrio litoralis DSM 11393 TaxID=1121455 RepID=A0A1M7SW48_9BACT|nr:Xaa-Pro peptidase family protein [Desulfovibrio litoralis]SHN62743.1 Xaa-Pro aminopeptidase [Desulfovibrio litoralis DSM 11393]